MGVRFPSPAPVTNQVTLLSDFFYFYAKITLVMNVDLLMMYQEIDKRIKFISFHSLWKGFHPFSFAVYNDKLACFKGLMIDKPKEFIANTAISFQGEQVAMFRVDEDEDLDIITSKIVHEMFHAYQNEQHDQRFPNEIEALFKYEYTNRNISIKLKENQILHDLVKHGFSQDKWDQFLSLKKYRSIHHPYSLRYESLIEQIEGTANYIELSVLKLLNTEKYEKKINYMLKHIINPHDLLPIRIALYDSGALLLLMMKQQQMSFNEGFTTEPFSLDLLQDVNYQDIEINDHIQEVIDDYYQAIDDIIDSIKQQKPLASGSFELKGLNIYNAKYHKGFIYTTYFVQYADHGEEKTLFGNYLIKMKDLTITEIYQIS